MISARSCVNTIASPWLVNSRTERSVIRIVGVTNTTVTNGPDGVCVVKIPVGVMVEREPVAVWVNNSWLVLIMWEDGVGVCVGTMLL